MSLYQEKKSELRKLNAEAVKLAQLKKEGLEKLRNIQSSIIEREFGSDDVWAGSVEKSINSSTMTTQPMSKSKKSKSKLKSKSKKKVSKGIMAGEELKATGEEIATKEIAVAPAVIEMIETPAVIEAPAGPKESISIDLKYFIGKHCGGVLYEGRKDSRSSSSRCSFIEARPTQIANIDELIDFSSNTRFIVTISDIINAPDGFQMLVAEPVVSITSFFKVEANKFASEEDQGDRSRWWIRISEIFKLLFGNVIHGLIYLHSSGHRCGDLANHIYVSAKGEAKVLPLMDSKMTEEHDVSNLIKKMKEIITLPFEETEVQEAYNLPEELIFMLQFVSADKLKHVPFYWLVNQPYFWLSGEKVHFVKDFKTLMKQGVLSKKEINFFFENNSSFASEDRKAIDWSKRIDGEVCNGLFKMVYDRPQSIEDIKEYEPENSCDLIRYMPNRYNHASDSYYRIACNSQVLYSEDEIEAYLYSFFPMVYVDLYAALYFSTSSKLSYMSKNKIFRAFENWSRSYLAPPKTLAASMEKGKKKIGLVQAGPLIIKPVSKSNLSPSLKALSRCAKQLGDEQIVIPVKKEVMNQTLNLYFGKDEIVQLLEKDKLDAAHISTYIRLLYEDCMENDLTKIFGFLCPSIISSSIVSKDAELIRMESEQQSDHILNALNDDRASDGKVYLAPFNIGDHWILCLINPIECIVYYLDPLRDQGRKIEQDLCNVVDTALRLYWKQEKSMTWKQIQCPQQDNVFDCGYYVLRFMREIIDHQLIHIPEAYFDDCALPTYDQGQINEVRDELACHALRFYVES